MPANSPKPLFYHLYSLGAFGCPEINPIAYAKPNIFQIQPVGRLAKIRKYYDHFQQLGVTHIYLGPIFESCTHGYDTINYFRLDRRLGTNQLFQEIINELHSLNLKVIIDGSFYHTSRLFPAFSNLRQEKNNSPFTNWYQDIDFSQNSSWNDGFSYKCYRQLSELPVLNHQNPEVLSYLYRIITYWQTKFQIDGWRLDVAYNFSPDFWHKFCSVSHEINSDIFIYGELIDNDFNDYVQSEIFDSATNYQLYQNAWQAFNSQNFWQLADTISEQQTKYNGLPLLNFSGSHDTNRLRSQLHLSTYIKHYFTFLFTHGNTPTLYYGDELGLVGNNDNLNNNIRQPLPSLDLITADQSELIEFITLLNDIRHQFKTINSESIKILSRHHRYLIYRISNNNAYVILNNYYQPATINLPEILVDKHFRDLLSNRKIRTGKTLELKPDEPLILIPI